MEQNVVECKDCIRRIKKKLEDTGYNIIVINDDILCKTPKKSTQVTTGGTLATYTSSRALSGTTCPLNTAGCIHSNGKSCTHSGACHVDSSKCPIHGNNNNSNSNTGNNSNSNEGTLEAISSYSDFLFRIRPTDIYNGIFLHAIILHGEHCDLKMTFSYDTDKVNDIINVINFLVE